jgi:hypothetical protein
MERRHCQGCGRPFHPRPQAPRQRYCSDPACQRLRRRRWQKERLGSDADYRENQAAAAKRWRAEHPEYWREYRRTHPGYTERNRETQRARNRRCGGAQGARAGPAVGAIANMDASGPVSPVPAGVYLLRPVTRAGIAKMDAWMVEISIVSAGCAARG